MRVGGRERGDELRDEIEVGFEGVPKHEGVDLQQGGSAVSSHLEEREALSLSWAP